MVGASAIEIQAQGIGCTAARALAPDQCVKVLGTTSRGVFLQTASRWVVFLSFESRLGPLTLTLGPGSERLRAAGPGSPGRCSAGHIHFPESGVRVSFGALEPWEAPRPGHAECPPARRLEQWMALTDEVPPDRRGSLLPTLVLLLRDPVVAEREGAAQHGRAASLVRLRRGLEAGDASRAARELIGLLGEGSGLTPAWDDLILGVLLALHRWPNARWDAGRRAELCEAVLREAYTRTTALSANLMECASAGDADERLLRAVDHVWTGWPSRAEALASVLDWGSTSGVDALAGMGLVAGG